MKLATIPQAEADQTKRRLKLARVLEEELRGCAYATGSTDNEGNKGLPQFCKAVECEGKGNNDACGRFLEASD